MQDLARALTDIKAMRSQIARSTMFRGYGPAAVAVTAVMALAAAYAQIRCIAAPARHPTAYIALWSATAAAAAAAIAVEMWFRTRRVHAGLADEMIQEAAGQLIPAAAAGAALTFTLLHYAPQTLFLLPGLWQIILALGIFSACRALPPVMNLVAFWYFCTGLACLAFAAGPHAFSPWAMGLPFAAGESLAAILIAVAGTADAE